MAGPSRQEKVDELMDAAEEALRGSKWFDAERHAQRALEMARTLDDWALMARIALPLQEARRQRVQSVMSPKAGIRIVEGEVPEEVTVEPGCYLVQPPGVGADARRMRLAALRQDVPVTVLCREPRTRMGLCPVVAIGMLTVRTKIVPPSDWDAPDMAWYAGAMEQLGDAAIAMLDTGLELDRQVDFVLSALDAVPDHEKLHQALAAVCKEASKGFVRSTTASELEAELEAAIEDPEIAAELGEPAPKKRRGDAED
jgi:hypothetical protein